MHLLHSFLISPVLKREINYARIADHLICVSRTDAKSFMKYGIDRDKIYVIPNGVNYEDYQNYLLDETEFTKLKTKIISHPSNFLSLISILNSLNLTGIFDDLKC